MPPIAVVGVAALFPGSSDKEGFWRDILAGRDLIGDIPPTRWLVDDWFDADRQAPDRLYVRRGAFLDPIPFDPAEFALPPAVLSATDSSQMLALVVARQVLEDAVGSEFAHVDRDRVSVILGCASATQLLADMAGRLQRPVWVKALREEGLPERLVQAVCARLASSYVPWTESTFPGLLGNVIAGRIANRFNLGGTNCVVDAACASSLTAVHMAVMELSLGTSDLVISGGVDTLNDPFMFMCFAKTQAMSPTGDCRPFSAEADGTMLGEGLCMVALRRLADAERDGDRIYAVLRGIGTSSDGRARSIYAPRAEGQVKALRRAYEAAGYGPETVELVEAHGTATPAGDAAEVAALRTVFEEARRSAGAAAGTGEEPWCALGSVKSQVGHTKAAAGAAGLFKAVMALHHKVLPPTIKVAAPHPALGLEGSPFYLNTQVRPWVRGTAHPRRAAVSAFGFGGANFHITVEEYAGAGRQPARLRTAPTELVVLAASAPPALAARCREVAQAAEDGQRLSDLAWHSQVGAKPDHVRLAVVVGSAAELASELRSVAQRLESGAAHAAATRPGGPAAATCTYVGEGEVPGTTALLLPGQGSQYLHMGADLAVHFDAARAIWDLAADLPLADAPEARLDRWVFPQPVFTDVERQAQAARLTATERAQPAIAAASLAAVAVLRAAGLVPTAVAGHSLGELTALCLAGAMDEATLLTLAARRGACVATATAGAAGAMVAVACGAAELEPRLAEWDLNLTVANRNAPDQTVLSGAAEAIAQAQQRLNAAGVHCQRLQVAAAFHSPAMAGAAAAFRPYLDRAALRLPSLPVYANRDGGPYPATGDAAVLCQRLSAHLTEPVRFVDQVEALYAAGTRIFLEVGPGAVLAGLAARTLGARPHLALSVDQRGRHGVTTLWQALGQLWAAGVPLDLSGLWGGYAAGVARPRPAMEIMISGANYGKPYPPADGVLPAPNDEPERAPQPARTDVGGFSAAGEIVPSPELPAPTIPEAAAPEAEPAGAGMPWPVSAAAPDGTLLAAFQEWTAQTAEAHRGYQRALTLGHEAFLHTAEQALAALTGTGARLPAPPTSPAHGAPASAASTPPAAEGRNGAAHPAPTAPVPTAASAPAELHADPRGILLAVVAEKTGYPPEMLDLDLELEAGLGIDSIKRVEILSALQERLPQLPEVQPADLAGLRTLGDILSLAEHGGAAAGPVAAVAVPAPAVADPRGILLAVVAEKTGYPPEMLDLDLELEAGLGIDSIKRVEILSALQERLPQLPEVQPADLAGMRTLGHILALAERGGAAAAADPSPAVAVTPALAAPALPTAPAGTAGAVPVLPTAPTGTATAVAVLPSAPGVTPAAPVHAVGRWAVAAVPAAPAGFMLPGLVGGGRWLVLDGGSGVGEALADALRARGADAGVADAVDAEARGAIFLGGLAPSSGPEAGMAVQRAAFLTATALARHGATGLVTVQDTGGDFGLSGQAGDRAWQGGLPGLVKSAAREWADPAVRALDVERGGRGPAALAAVIAAELLGGGPELEVGLGADGTRRTLVLRPTASPTRGCALPAGAVVIATGGARGITAACLEALASAVPLQLVILGRTPLGPEPDEQARAQGEAALRGLLLAQSQAAGRRVTPAEIEQAVARILAAREARGHLAQLEQMGVAVRYVVADVRDAAAVAQAVHSVRQQWGPVVGVIHAAGALADRHLREKTPEQFAYVFGTKVEGIRNLLAAVAQEPLRLLCCFSSLAGRTGNAGQADYAMANETLAQVLAAESARRGADCVVRSIAWGPWDGGMVTPALRSRFQDRGIPLLPVAEGARRFVAETAPDADGVAVVVAAGPAGTLHTQQVWTMAVALDAASNPEVEDHRIRGLAVLPLVSGMEWFARAAEAVFPGKVLAALRDLRVHHAVRLPDFGRSAYRFVIRATWASEDSVGLELLAADGRVHFTAVAELRAPGQVVAAPVPLTEAPGASWPWTADEVYATGRLFHGPRFRVLRQPERVSAEGASARVVGVASLQWPEAAWRTDPGMLDAGLQLALLWGLHTFGRPSLPTGVERMAQYQSGPVSGDVRCLLRSRVAGSLRTVSDLAFLAADGTTLAELRGLQMHFQEAGA